MLGRIAHYAADAVLFSTLLAGVKRSAGLSPDLDRITSEAARNVAEKYVGVGEFIFDTSVAAAHASQFFKSTSSTSNAPIPSPLAKLAEKTQPKESSSWWK